MHSLVQPPKPDRFDTSIAFLVVFLSAASTVKLFLQNSLVNELKYGQAFWEVSTLLAASILASVGLLHKRTPINLHKLHFLLFGFCGLGVVFSIYSWNPLFSAARGLLFLTIILNVLSAIAIIGTDRVLSYLYTSTVIIVCAGIALALLDPTGYPLFVADIGEEDLRRRLWLYRMHPIEVADISAMAFIVGLSRRFRYKWLWQSFLVVVTLATVARASIVLFAIMSSAAAYKKLRGLKTRVLVVSGAIAFIVIVIGVFVFSDSLGFALVDLLTPITNPVVLMEQTAHNSNLTGRTELWSALISGLSPSNLLGYGFSGARRIIHSYGGWAYHAHNSLLEAIFTSGYVGACLLFAFYSIVAYRGMCAVKRLVVISSLILISYGLAQGLTEPTLIDQYCTMFMIVASSAIIGPFKRHRSSLSHERTDFLTLRTYRSHQRRRAD